MSRKGGVACAIESLLFKMWEEMRRCRKERKGIDFVCAKCGTRHEVKVLDRDEMSEKCPDSE